MTLTDENCTDAYVSCENDDTNGFTCTLAGEGDTCSLN